MQLKNALRSMAILPQSFRFSLKVTVFCIVLASIMLWCSRWQWGRYQEKKALIATYEQNTVDPVAPFPVSARTAEDFSPLINRRVHLTGRYDLTRQLIVTNKKHASGPGHWLFVPFILDGSEHAVLLSRGFIPFADRSPAEWKKYDVPERDSFDAVVKATKVPWKLGPKNPAVTPNGEYQTRWFFEEVEKMAQQLPYPTITPVFLQRIGQPALGDFPAQAISIDVPPSTHFGYTIEWALLAFATVSLGFLYQAYPRKRITVVRGSNESAPPPTGAVLH